jgi:transcription initiation factor IIF auxiliary subunit
MRRGSRWLRHASWLVSLLVTALASSSAAQEISAANTAQYVGDDRWNWTIFIDAPPEVLSKVRCVEYKLHPTFPHPNQKICKNLDPAHPFALSSNGWGTFEIPIRVIFKNGRIQSLKHQLQFRTAEVRETLPIKTRNTASRIGSNWWNWTVFIEAPENILAQVNCVEYTLHSTFANPLREICARGTGPAFALSESGWGTFSVLIRVLLKDGRVQELTHQLEFR